MAAPHLEFSSGTENEPSTSSTPPVPTLYLDLEECNFKGKINTYCKMAEECSFIEKCLSDHPDGMTWLKDSQFGPLFGAAPHTDMILIPLWILLSRKVKSPKKLEIWFVLNGIPIRYSLMEHALISGLNCDDYPKECIPVVANENFCSRFFGTKKVTVANIREVLANVKIPEEVEPPTGDGDTSISSVRQGGWAMVKDDKLKLSLLYLLSSVLFFAGNENANIDSSLIQIVENLEFAKTYPWGRRSYGFLIEHLTSLDMAQKKLSRNPQWKCPGFIIPLMLLPFECMSALSPAIGQLRENVNPTLPRMCKWSTKPKVKKQYPSFDQLLKLVVNTKDISSIIKPTPEERASTDMEFPPFFATNSIGDPTTDAWTAILEKGGQILFEDMYLADVAGKCSSLGLNRIEDISDLQPESDPCASSAIRPDSVPLFSSIPHPKSAPGHSTEPNNEVFRILGEILGKISDMDSKVDVRLASIENRLSNVENQFVIFQRFQRDDEPVSGVAPDVPVNASVASERNNELPVADGEVANVLMELKHEDILPFVVDREYPKREQKKSKFVVSLFTDLAANKKATKSVFDPLTTEGQLIDVHVGNEEKHEELVFKEVNVDMDSAPLSVFHQQIEKRKMPGKKEQIILKKVKVEKDALDVDEAYYFVPFTEAEKRQISQSMSDRPKNKSLLSGNGSKTADIWSVQCGECFKWRIIPTREGFEEIRSNFTDDPFVCTKKPETSCDDPTDIEYDNSRTWVIDKPNIPKTPSGFKRSLVMRKGFSKMDCYYDAPNGKRLRAPTDVVKFIDKNPEYKKEVSVSDFSFAGPKIMEDTLPASAAKKV